MRTGKFFGWGVALALAVGLPSWAVPATVSAIASNNNIGFKMMSEVTKLDKEPKNRFISPLSLHVALSMTLNGTNDQTRERMLSLLGYPHATGLDEINEQNLNLVKALFRAPMSEEEKAARPTWKGLPPVFTIFNSGWTTNGGGDPYKKYEFSESFLKDMGAYYQLLQVQSLDFKKEAAADAINDWTKTATQGLIPKIIDSESLQKLLWVLINTTYLEAQWEKPFTKTEGSLNFQRLDGKTVVSPKMIRASEMPLVQTPDFTLVELGLNESHLKTYILAPKTARVFSKLQKSETSLWNQSFWNHLLSQLQPGLVRLEMAPFTVSDEVLLLEDQPLTNNLGLNFLFKNTTDLSRMDAPGVPPSKVGIIKQNTKLEWNEKGIKAAAATLVGGAERTSSPPGRWTHLTLDKPFYFAVYDQETRTFLFLGQMVDPSQK